MSPQEPNDEFDGKFATVTKMRVAEKDTRQNDCARPKAVGFVRDDVSGMEAPRHAAAAQRHASNLGYQYVYTVRPPHDTEDPVGYALGIASGLGVAVVVVFDLATVDNSPARVCDEFDFETVCSPITWARAVQSSRTETEAVA
ncbi:hypothetical protein ACIHDR_19880 [Nocardia sp. NPDC052278]|uniref:hypothetical protein n=1 Tax=Nocardia sp. NPDC052278 TaxID=3364328 RepID=UPI0037CA5F12